MKTTNLSGAAPPWRGWIAETGLAAAGERVGVSEKIRRTVTGLLWSAIGSMHRDDFHSI